MEPVEGGGAHGARGGEEREAVKGNGGRWRWSLNVTVLKFSRLETAPSEGEMKGVQMGVEAETTLDVLASLGTGERHGGSRSRRQQWRYRLFELKFKV
jgi:hypothetical protein